MKAKFKKWDIVEVKIIAATQIGVVGRGQIIAEPIEHLGEVRYKALFDSNEDPKTLSERYLILVKRPFFGGLFKRRKYIFNPGKIATEVKDPNNVKAKMEIINIDE